MQHGSSDAVHTRKQAGHSVVHATQCEWAAHGAAIGSGDQRRQRPAHKCVWMLFRICAYWCWPLLPKTEQLADLLLLLAAAVLTSLQSRPSGHSMTVSST